MSINYFRYKFNKKEDMMLRHSSDVVPNSGGSSSSTCICGTFMGTFGPAPIERY